MIEGGVIKRLQYSNDILIKEQTTYEEFLEVDFLAIISIIMLLIVGYLAALLIFLGEIIYFICSKKRNRFLNRK